MPHVRLAWRSTLRCADVPADESRPRVALYDGATDCLPDVARPPPTRADLVWCEGTYSLHITQNRETPATTESGGVLGVDLGRAELATDSDGEHYSGAKVKGMRAYHRRRRRIVQKVGTHSARRKLRKTKRRESRFARNTAAL